MAGVAGGGIYTAHCRQCVLLSELALVSAHSRAVLKDNCCYLIVKVRFVSAVCEDTAVVVVIVKCYTRSRAYGQGNIARNVMGGEPGCREKSRVSLVIAAAVNAPCYLAADNTEIHVSRHGCRLISTEHLLYLTARYYGVYRLDTR